MIYFNFSNKEFKEVMTRAGVVVVKKDHIERALLLLSQFAYPSQFQFIENEMRVNAKNLLIEMQEDLNDDN